MNLDQYKNSDGTYTSPRNNKTYQSLTAFRSHINYKSDGFKASRIKLKITLKECQFCKENRNLSNIRKHETSCYLNPKNIRTCEVCIKPIKNYKSSKGTCSHSCSNVRFRSGTDNGNWKDDRYRSTCFAYHEKKCIICGEQKIVAVHHYNENHGDNRPENLVPMCPTHHQYMHSRYKDELSSIVDTYVKNFISG